MPIMVPIVQPTSTDVLSSLQAKILEEDSTYCAKKALAELLEQPLRNSIPIVLTPGPDRDLFIHSVEDIVNRITIGSFGGHSYAGVLLKEYDLGIRNQDLTRFNELLAGFLELVRKAKID